MIPRQICGLLWLICLGTWLALPRRATGQDAALSSELLRLVHFREIGPAVTGGRIHDVEALPDDPATIYVATASGGLWKSVNNGTTWQSLFDRQPVSTFGDLAVAPSNANVLWAGTGEQNNRQSTSWGNGVYRSTDGGRTWAHLGLDESRHIGRVLVHPANPDVAYVAALGNLWKPNVERGVFQTTDGGRTWRQSLYVDSLTGVVDLVMDPNDPNTLYAAAYQRLRRTWGFNGGGPGSGIFKTTDAGATWRRLAGGLPPSPIGRVGLAIARSDPTTLYATIEHASQGGTYRSADRGATWRRVNALNPRPMYYSAIYVDPRDANRVYVLGTDFYVSDDGGQTFRQLPTAPTYDVGVHSDFHALWIDPNNTKHFFLAGDGGLYETWDRGETYRKINNISIAQFYDIGVDMREPYYVYGGLQDNHSWVGPGATRHWIGIVNDDWREIGFGDGAYHQVDPTSHRYAYSNSTGGGFTRVDVETGDILDIQPHPPAGEPPYRWDWVTPTLVSAHDPSTVYAGGNRLFISHDRGVSWERTPDLSRRINRDTLSLMGVRGSDIVLSRNDGESSFGEITTIAESPLDAKVLWVGTDDGNVQVSRDGGRTWAEVSRNIRGMPNSAYVSRVVASAAGPGAAYVTLDAHRDGDFAPYVFRSADFGQTWISRSGGLPTGSAIALVEHPRNPNLVFLGTEHALFVSGSAGAAWVRLTADLPTTLFQDIVVHPRDNDLIVGTHGRGAFVWDDLTPLVDWSSSIAEARAHLFPIRPATIFQFWEDFSYRGQAAYAGENPPFGAIINFYVGAGADSGAVTISDSNGLMVRRIAVQRAAGALQRVIWDLRHESPPADPRANETGPAALPVLAHPISPRGPFVSPGTYTVVLEANGTRVRQSVQVRADPLMPVTLAQYRERERFLLDVLADQQRVAEAVRRAGARSGGGDTLAALRRQLTGLRRELAGLAGELNGNAVQPGSLYPPTETQKRRKQELEAALQKAVAQLDRMP